MSDYQLKKTVIIIHPHFTMPGGAGTVALEIGKRLATRYTVIAIAQQVWPEYMEQYPEITFKPIGGPRTSSLTFWAFLPYWCWRTSRMIDASISNPSQTILFCNVFPAHWFGLWYKCRHVKVRAFWYCHEPSAFIHNKIWRNAIQSRWKRAIANLLVPVFSMADKLLVKQVEKIFVNSEYGLKQLRAVYGRTGIIIYPGVNVSRFPNSIQINKRPKMILAVARLSAYKRTDLLLHAFAQFADPDYQLVIVGDGEELSTLICLAKQLGIERKVRFTGRLSDDLLNQLYGQARLFALCSHEEPFGMVVIEAMAAGCIPIAEASGGPQEIIENGVSGILLSKMTAESLAASFSRLVADLTYLDRMQQNGQERIKSHFSWKHAAEQFVDEI